jgi:DNA invertase Pin-like site-specific DNA recombinase
MEDALGYIRVSSEEQADSGLGLEAQRQRIAAY